jgi:Mrp family chromosome partitioning ATPase
VPDQFGAVSTQLGLSNYLAFETSDPTELVQPTPVFGVDHLSAGTATISQDTLATHRMRELLEALRQTYTIILVAGPPVTADTDVQLLAAHQDGVVVLFDGASPVSASTQAVFRTYQRIGLPLIGCVEIAC